MADDDIVIVGVGCKFPGADNLEEYWGVLSNGENHVKEIPKERWNHDAHYDPDPNATGQKTYARKAGFINRYDEWDHHLFGINDMESETIDPQQRVVLDCVHMALEDGGITRKDIDGTQTGVYIGSMNDDYKSQMMQDTNVTSTYLVTGTHNSIISARVSYVYNLFGPAITIDTACSSSLVAIHLASQALALGDIDVAICGGVNLLLDPAIFFSLSKARMLSRTGQCQAFSADADGYARGEGCGIVILKKLKQARQDGNKIWGIIYSGSNQDGHMTSPITSPSGHQQGQLLNRMYTKNKINKDHMQVIEAHGTGTPIGDPIESNALSQFFRGQDNMKRTDTLYIGSVKTNIGHTEAAAGVAGLIKVLLMIKNEQIVPSLMYQKSKENPKLQFHKYGIEVVTKTQPWGSREDYGRLACINSFGFGGTNAHVIVKECPIQTNENSSVNGHKNDFPYLIAITASDKESLQENMRTFLGYVKGNIYNMASLSFTSTCKRDHKRIRKCFAVESQESLVGLCETFLSTNNEISSQKPRICFVFCGVGTTWNGMCQDMLKFDVFNRAVEEIDQVLSPLTGWRIQEKLLEGKEVVSNPLIAHIAIFACQVGLLALMKDFGIRPDAVLGQSVGEVAAAYASGSIDIGSAVQIIYHRSKQLSKVSKGGMAVVKGVQKHRLDEFCNASDKIINIAVFNSPTSCTVSGDNDEIDRLKIELMRDDAKGEGVVIDLNVQCAYHSEYVAKAADSLESNLTSLTPGVATIPIISTVTGKQEAHDIFLQHNYWKKNMQSPVKFQQAITTAASSPEGTIFVEIGPSPVLRAHLKNILNDESRFITVPTLRKQKVGTKSLADAICILFEHGFEPNWQRIVPFAASTTDIPKYAFTKHKSLYIPKQVALKNQGIVAKEKDTAHPFCQPMLSENGLPEIEATINEISTPFVFQHIVKGAIIVPGAVYVEIGCAIGKVKLEEQENESSIYVEFVKPVNVYPGTTSILKTESSFDDTKCIRFKVKHKDSVVCNGKVMSMGNKTQRQSINILQTKTRLQASMHRKLNSDQMYEALRQRGFQHGESFQVMKSCITDGKCSLVEIEIPDDVMKTVESTTIHPCVLDGIIQTSITLTDDRSLRLIQDENLIMMPVAIERITVFKKSTKHMLVLTTASNVLILDSVIKLHYNMQLLDTNGSLIAEVTNYMSYSRRQSHITPDELKYRLSWKLIPRDQPIESKAKIIVIDITNETSRCKQLNDEKCIVYQMSTNHPKGIRDALENKVASIAEQRWGSLQETDALVLLFENEIQTDLTITDANRIYQRSKTNCMFLIALLKALMGMEFKIPLYITTQNTQRVSCVDEEVPINLVGNDIWGFVRNVQIEFVHTKMTMVDVIPSIEETSVSLFQYINANHASIEKSNSEIVICRDNVYCSEFIKTNMAEITPEYIKTKCVSKTCQQEIYSEAKGCMTGPFLKQQAEKILIMDRQKGEEEMLLSSVFIHEPTFAKVTTQSVLHSVSNDEQTSDGHLVFGLEYSGLLVKREKCRLFRYGEKTTKCIQPEKSDILSEHVAVFPQSLKTEVRVPRECCISIHDVPSYRPGILAKSIMYLTMLQHVPVKSKVICITESNDIKLFQTFLETHRTSYMVTDQTADVVLVTCSIRENQYDCIMRAKRVIFIKGTIQMEMVDMLLQFENGNKKDCIAVDSTDVFDRKNIAKYLKIAAMLLKRHFVDNNDQTDNSGLAIGKSFIVRSSAGNLALPVKARLENLFSQSDIVIITGGLTGLGWELLLLLADMGVGTIVTMSRRKLSESKSKDVKEIEKKFQCNIECIQVDVTDLSSLQSMMSKIQNTYKHGHIRGVIHGAGVLDSQLLIKLEEDHLERVMCPKILGTMNMHIVTRHVKLDFFLMQSSIAVFIGQPGQGNYGAANAFMDSIALWRRHQGLPAQTINWGALDLGMAARKNFADNFVKRGYPLLPIPEIRSCFLQALAENISGTVYSKLEWNVIVNHLSDSLMSRVKLMFDTLLTQKNIKWKDSPKANTKNDYNQDNLRTCDRAIQMSEMSKLVEHVIKRVVGADIHELKLTSSLSELGIDSMAAVTFVNAMYDITSFRMKQSFLMDYDRCINDIVTLFVDTIFGQDKAVKTKVVHPLKLDTIV